MGNCLVTRLKGVVDDDALGKLNTLVIDLITATGSGSPNSGLLIRTGSEAVNLTFKVPVHAIATTGNLVSSYTVDANSTVAFYIASNTPVTPGLITVENIYNIVMLVSYSPNLSFAATPKSGMMSMKYDNNLIYFGASDVDLDYLPSSLYRLQLHNNDITHIYNIDDVLSRNLLQIVEAGIVNYTRPFIQLTSRTAVNTSLKGVKMRCKGSIDNLPTSVVVMDQASSETTGSVEDFVARARAAGRTSGSISFKGKNDWHVTYNGQWLRELSPQTDNCIFTWTASTLELATSVPQEVTDVYTNMSSQASWQPM